MLLTGAPRSYSIYKVVAALAAQLQKDFGRLDILVNNAGVVGFGVALHKMPVEQWDAILNTNLRGNFYTSKLWRR